ncbi:MAG: class I SAM-dependent methyltransferase [Candidatus Woesearchaeota archaeon]
MTTTKRRTDKFTKKNYEVIKEYNIFYNWGIRYRLKRLARFLRGGEKVLDIGYAAIPNPFIKNAYGLDIFVPSNKPKNYSKIFTIDMDKPYPYPFKDKSFDCIIAGETIEHLPDLDSFMKEVYRLLKPGGVLALSTPNPESPIEVAIHFWHWVKGYNLNYRIKGDHVHEFPTTNMITLLNVYGFEPFNIEGSYIQIPFTRIQIPMNIVPLTYCTIYHARKSVSRKKIMNRVK